MDHIAARIEKRYQNIILDGFDPVTSGGFTQVPNFILKSSDLSVGAKLTYSMLLSYAWQNDFCFPGQETLAGDMGSGKRSVVRYIDELEKAACISIKRQGLGKPNVYTLHLKIRKK
jgi:helix-turn-helix protein